MIHYLSLLYCSVCCAIRRSTFNEVLLSVTGSLCCHVLLFLMGSLLLGLLSCSLQLYVSNFKANSYFKIQGGIFWMVKHTAHLSPENKQRTSTLSGAIRPLSAPFHSSPFSAMNPFNCFYAYVKQNQEPHPHRLWKQI